MKNILLFSVLATIFSCSNQKGSTLHEDVKFLEKVCVEYSYTRLDYLESESEGHLYADVTKRVNVEILQRLEVKKENSLKKIRLLHAKLKAAREKIKDANFSSLDEDELLVISRADNLIADALLPLK